MEIAGLALGAVSLSSLFVTCFDTYDKIKSIHGAAGDLADVLSRLDLELQKLHYINKKHRVRELDKDAEDVMILAQHHINQRLETIYSTIAQYLPDASAKPSTRGSSAKPRKVLKWVASDRKALDEQLGRLQNVTETLWRLATTAPERAREDYILRANALSATNASLLVATAEPLTKQYASIVKAARVKQLLLQCIERGPDVSSNSQQPTKLALPLSSFDWRSKDAREVVDLPWVPGICEMTESYPSDIPVIVEWRGPFMGHRDPNRRLDRLCEFLRAMHRVDEESDFSDMDLYARNADFGILKCLGWTKSSDTFDRIGLVFQCPQRNSWQPVSLQGKILEMRPKRRPPPLGDRFDLAFGICSAVANIISIGWTHRAIRSDNMLIFDRRSIQKVFLVGFTYARPWAPDGSDAPQELSNLPNHRVFALYRPGYVPEAQDNDDDSSGDEEMGDPELATQSEQSSFGPGSAAFDLYGLGIVLLEVGLWETVEKMKERKKDLTVQQFQAYGLKDFLAQLSYRCGDIYRDVVERCLTPAHWKPETLTENIGNLIGDLKQCRA
ncbi:hypothetical protein B0I35DRAFT_426200 [Stachybotrys elegans]|uniref:Prion-inhibition and propagation HeLo domain-containing protein n=1 Tax=Stachybotrys elegans TaxID=80388 RepID=A0A8K0WSW8_9HYPO|nr:hypothetical protein B0I35DRAFT_426200 [Stachybotrys elegans]